MEERDTGGREVAGVHGGRQTDRERWARAPFILFLSILLVGAMGVVDYLTGWETSLGLFYLVPVCIAVWLVGRWAGVAVSGLGAISWLLAELASRPSPYSHPAIPVWNATSRLGFFLIVALLLARVRSMIEHERRLARTDSLTDAANYRGFREMAELELARARRYERPLSLAYVDIDDFKRINDTLGHAAGDRVLVEAAEAMRRTLRRTDTVARIGGDEFAILMPETDAGSAVRTVERLRDEVARRSPGAGPAMSLSVGLLTCREVPPTVDDLVQEADEVMYEVKRGGKGSVKQRVVGRNGDAPRTAGGREARHSGEGPEVPPSCEGPEDRAGRPAVG